jgi:hypothetical protein
MVIFIINGVDILSDETKGKAPIATDLYRPSALTITNQFVQIQTGEVHVLRTGGSMQAAKYETQSFSMLRLDASQTSLSEKTFQTFVFKIDDHPYNVTCEVSSVNIREQ